MRIVIFGAGYVGLTMSACLSEVGNNVTCVDIDESRIALLNKGKVPIYEPGLEDLIVKGLQNKNLSFATLCRETLEKAELIFIAVGTPFEEAAKEADLSQVKSVAQAIGDNIQNPGIVVVKSTVPVGTTKIVGEIIDDRLKQRGESVKFDMVFNPEFLKEGTAIHDCLKPDRIVIGTESVTAKEVLINLYKPFNRNHNRIINMDIASAELTKFTANSMLATKISLMNEIALIADRVDADIEKVRQGIGSDPRIGYDFIYAGCGYGGSCFPKDVRSLIHTGNKEQLDCHILQAVNLVNEQQKKYLFKKIMSYFNQNVNGKTFALWGVSFKPETDDIREAPSIVLMQNLWACGAKVKVYDPQALYNLNKLFGDRDDLLYADSMYEALEGADSLVVCTEWQAFKAPDLDLIKEKISHPVVFDGRNLYSPSFLRDKGLDYIGIGIQNVKESSRAKSSLELVLE